MNYLTEAEGYIEHRGFWASSSRLLLVCSGSSGLACGSPWHRDTGLLGGQPPIARGVTAELRSSCQQGALAGAAQQGLPGIMLGIVVTTSTVFISAFN